MIEHGRPLPRISPGNVGVEISKVSSTGHHTIRCEGFLNVPERVVDGGCLLSPGDFIKLT
jgi:hypothetical protein